MEYMIGRKRFWKTAGWLPAQKGETDFQKLFSSIALFSALHNQSIPVTIHYFQEKSIEKIRLIVENTIKKKWSMKKGGRRMLLGDTLLLTIRQL